MARKPGLHHELVLIDQSQLRQRQRELHASRRTGPCSVAVSAAPPPCPDHRARARRSSRRGSGCLTYVLLCRVDRRRMVSSSGTGSRPRRRPKGRLHHLVSHPAEDEGIGAFEDCGRVTVYSSSATPARWSQQPSNVTLIEYRRGPITLSVPSHEFPGFDGGAHRGRDESLNFSAATAASCRRDSHAPEVMLEHSCQGGIERSTPISRWPRPQHRHRRIAGVGEQRTNFSARPDGAPIDSIRPCRIRR